MSRSLKKGSFTEKYLFNKVEKLNQAKKKQVIKVYTRDSDIHPDFIGHTFGVYNGKSFLPVYITNDMVGHKLGEFSPTRKFGGHGSDKKRGKG